MAHCCHKGMDMVSYNTQVGCGIYTMLNWYEGAQSVQIKYPPHHYTTTTSLNLWDKTEWIHAFMFFMPNSDPTIWMSEHKSRRRPSADPVLCDISLILSFLQELLKKGCSPSTLKVYVAAIAASHALIEGQSMDRNNLVHFLKGSRRLNPPRPVTVPTCPLMLKSALLLALASVKLMWDLQVLSVRPLASNLGLTIQRSSWNQGMAAYLKCSRLCSERRW